VKGHTSRKALTTREKLLDAAERLFFKKGYDAVNVRDLTEAAGVNVASINYHFRGKRNLYREVLRRRLSEIAKGKIDLLGRVAGESGKPDLREVVRTYVASILREILSSREAEKFMDIVSVEMSEGGIATDLLFKEMVSPVHRTLRDAIRRARPGLTDRKISLCISSITGQLFHFLRARGIIKRTMKCGYSKEFMDEIVEHITDFSLKGIGK
jgi:AcrR family transcriptional regulator